MYLHHQFTLISPLCSFVVSTEDLTFAPTLSVNHHGPLAEGATYLLQCHVRDVAPARYLDVTWYKGDAVMPSANPLHSSYPSSPSNVTASLWITPMREDNGAQFRCEAGLRLGEGGPQPPPPRMASASLGITVHCELAWEYFLLGKVFFSFFYLLCFNFVGLLCRLCSVLVLMGLPSAPSTSLLIRLNYIIITTALL